MRPDLALVPGIELGIVHPVPGAFVAVDIALRPVCWRLACLRENVRGQ